MAIVELLIAYKAIKRSLRAVPRIALAQLGHKIAIIEHGLAHLLLLLCLGQLVLILVEVAHSSLVEHVLLLVVRVHIR